MKQDKLTHQNRQPALIYQQSIHLSKQSHHFQSTQQYQTIINYSKSTQHLFKIMTMLAQNNILYKQKISHWREFYVKFQQQTDNFLNLQIVYGHFTVPIRMFIKYVNEKPQDSHIVSFGTFGTIYDSSQKAEHSGICHRLVSKEIKHPYKILKQIQGQIAYKKQEQIKAKIYKSYIKEEIKALEQKLDLQKKKFKKCILEFIREYTIAKICSSLQIGPQLYNEYYDIIIYDEMICFRMENCLKNQIDNHKLQQDLKQSLTIMHYLSIVHSDIKPSNLGYSQKYKKYVFLDFGLSTINREPVGYCTKVDKFMGTYSYCSQEMRRRILSSQPQLIDLYSNDWHGLNVTLIEFQGEQTQRKMLIRAEKDENKMRVRHFIKEQQKQQLCYIQWPKHREVSHHKQLNYIKLHVDVNINKEARSCSIINCAKRLKPTNYREFPNLDSQCKNDIMKYLVSQLQEQYKQKYPQNEFSFFKKIFQIFQCIQPLQAFDILYHQINNQRLLHSLPIDPQTIRQLQAQLQNNYIFGQFTNKKHPKGLSKVLSQLVTIILNLTYQSKLTKLKQFVADNLIQKLLMRSVMRIFLPDLSILIDFIKDPIQRIDTYFLLSFFKKINEKKKQAFQQQLINAQNSQRNDLEEQLLIKLKQLLIVVQKPLLEIDTKKFKLLLEQLFFLPLFVIKLKCTFTICFEKAKVLFVADRKFLHDLQNFIKYVQQNKVFWDYFHVEELTQKQLKQKSHNNCLEWKPGQCVRLDSQKLDFYCEKIVLMLRHEQITDKIEKCLRQKIKCIISYCKEAWYRFELYNFVLVFLTLFPISRFVELTKKNLQLRQDILKKTLELEEILNIIAPLFIEGYQSQQYQQLAKTDNHKNLIDPMNISKRYFQAVVAMDKIRQQLGIFNYKKCNVNSISNIINFLHLKLQNYPVFKYYYLLEQIEKHSFDYTYLKGIQDTLKHERDQINILNLVLLITIKTKEINQRFLNIRVFDRLLAFENLNLRYNGQDTKLSLKDIILQFNNKALILRILNQINNNSSLRYDLNNIHESRNIFTLLIQYNQPTLFFEYFCSFSNSCIVFDIQFLFTFQFFCSQLDSATGKFLQNLSKIVSKKSPLSLYNQSQSKQLTTNVQICILLLHLYLTAKLQYQQLLKKAKAEQTKHLLFKTVIFYELISLHFCPIGELKRKILQMYYIIMNSNYSAIFEGKPRTKQMSFYKQWIRQICKSIQYHGNSKIYVDYSTTFNSNSKIQRRKKLLQRKIKQKSKKYQRLCN